MHRIGIRHQQIDPHRGATQRMRTKIVERRGFIGHKQACFVDDQGGENLAFRRFDTELLNRAECLLVELNSRLAVTDTEIRDDGCLGMVDVCTSGIQDSTMNVASITIGTAPWQSLR
jgi:hypothetical protein